MEFPFSFYCVPRLRLAVEGNKHYFAVNPLLNITNFKSRTLKHTQLLQRWENGTGSLELLPGSQVFLTVSQDPNINF